MRVCTISFGGAFAPVQVPQGDDLVDHLDVHNSPVLYGCRTGICGTCVIKATGALLPPDDNEREILDIYAPGEPDARLACQLVATGDLCVEARKG